MALFNIIHWPRINGLDLILNWQSKVKNVKGPKLSKKKEIIASILKQIRYVKN